VDTSIVLIAGITLLAVALGAVIYTIVAHTDEKSMVRNSLRQLEGYEVENVRDQQLLAPITERALVPVLGRLTSIGRRFTPVGYVDPVRKKYIQAGNGSAEAVDRFMALRVVAVAAILPVLWFVFILNPIGFEGFMQFVVALIFVGVAVFGPDAVLNRRVSERQHDLRVTLPDVLDLLTISVEAGLGFEQALDRVIGAVPGPLSDEFARMLGEVRAGSSRGDAMRALDQRTSVPEIRSFVLAILQADTFGVSIGRVLRAQSEEMRIKRRQLAQEKAQKAPVKMLIPMVFCIFPALFVVIIGPAAINIQKSFSG
jgi:tight adherence protein C